MKKLIPDYELMSCKKYFSSVISSNNSCHEAFFGLGRLYSYEGRYYEGLKYINIAISIYPDLFYIQWSVVLAIKCNQSIKAENSLCTMLCCLPKKTANQELLLSRLETLPKTTTTLWCYMELCRTGVESEATEYYATCIKDSDQYLGYLAWSDIYMNSSAQQSIDILKELIKQNLHRPEAYLKLWNYYYYDIKNYEQAEDIASEAFLRVTDSEYNSYYIYFCLACAKSYFKTGKISSALELLQKKFIENNEFPIFLYQFARFCVKSEDFSYNGCAIGALKECIKLCEPSKIGCIYYWLSKAYIHNRYHLEAYKYIEKSLKFLNSAFQNKREKLITWKNDMEEHILMIKTAEEYLSECISPKNLVECLSICKKIKNFHKLYSSILLAKLMWKIDKRKEAIEKLNFICSMSTVKITGYYELLLYLKESNECVLYEQTAAQMVAKCKNSQVPTNIWVKANILYAKALVHNKKPAKAIIVLKAIAKVFTPMPYANIVYTRTLQKAKTVLQLLNPQDINVCLYDSYKNSFANIRDFSSKIIDAADAPQPDTQEFKGRRPERTVTEGLRCFKKICINLDYGEDEKIDENFLLIPELSNTNGFIAISVCSNSKFLYLLAKIALKYNICIEDGKCAIQDYIELLKKCWEKSTKSRENIIFLEWFIIK